MFEGIPPDTSLLAFPYNIKNMADSFLTRTKEAISELWPVKIMWATVNPR